MSSTKWVCIPPVETSHSPRSPLMISVYNIHSCQPNKYFWHLRHYEQWLYPTRNINVIHNNAASCFLISVKVCRLATSDQYIIYNKHNYRRGYIPGRICPMELWFKPPRGRHLHGPQPSPNTNLDAPVRSSQPMPSTPTSCFFSGHVVGANGTSARQGADDFLPLLTIMSARVPPQHYQYMSYPRATNRLPPFVPALTELLHHDNHLWRSHNQVWACSHINSWRGAFSS